MVREIVVRGLSERRALTVVRMSAAALRYVPRPDPDPDLRERIVTLAHRHRRYDAGMIYLKAAPGRCVVNHKRVDRRYAEARRQVRRRRRKKVPSPIVSHWRGHRRRMRCGQRTSSSIARRKDAC